MTDKKTSVASAAPNPTRRKFIAGAAGAAGVAGLAFPMISKAQAPITLRFQSTWPAKDIFHEYAQDYVKRVNDMAGGRLKLDLLPAGAVVGALQMQDAVNSGALDGGHGVCAYWYGKNKAYSLFGTAPAFGWEPNDLLAWFSMPTQPLGWVKKPVSTVAEIQKLKYRTVGLAADLMKDMGVQVTIMGGADIVPAMDRGVLDAAEFNNPSSDRALGFADVAKTYMLQSFHQRMECFEIIFNKKKYESLPKDLQAILKVAVEACSSDMSWKWEKRYPDDLDELRKVGVKDIITPKAILQAQLDAWDRVIANLSADPFFKKVIDSQKAWAHRIGEFRAKWDAPNDMAYAHFFGKK